MSNTSCSDLLTSMPRHILLPVIQIQETENDAGAFVNRRFSKQKLVNVCQSMENYFYICPA